MTVLSMPHHSGSAQPLADSATVVLGVDTHKDVHVAAVVSILGALLGTQAFPATAAGYRELLFWAGSLGVVRQAGVEGTGSYGAGLARHLAAEGVEVIEVNRPDRAARRRSGKTDAVDAEAAARAVLGGRATGAPKSKDGPVEELRVLKVVKDSAVRNRTQAINQLKALLVSASPQLRESLAGLSNPALFKACAALDPQASAVHQALHLLARRVKQLSTEATTLTRKITAIIQAHNPQLLELTGVGPDSAAILLIAAGDNHDRLRDEASFAALCGVSPVERSSGKSQRRRLNRGGNRQANAALYRIVLSRLRWEERSLIYLQRRTAEGKTKREVIRCLKRYVAREIHRAIASAPLPVPNQLAA
ncbi:IS110 family transposase [Streptomyces soliscabiei]|uniref:IS110 family transposase n=1 Tax=Streptomyces soliscabiei TaxID=588897 RepID=UPI0029AE065D|nr:IS110 family transposase [Streptomyces sp. NY05-11A]MDX2682189.1 IS110 family transposase [Streptomyces sp. NY05-11A]